MGDGCYTREADRLGRGRSARSAAAGASRAREAEPPPEPSSTAGADQAETEAEAGEPEGREAGNWPGPAVRRMRSKHNAEAAEALRTKLRLGQGGRITLGDCGLESSDEEEGAAGGRAPSVSGQVVTFVKGVLRPYHKSKLITTEEYKQVAERASRRILERHAGEASGDFLIRASEKITRLVNEYVKAVKRHRKKKR